jgi:hypothetical protein
MFKPNQKSYHDLTKAVRRVRQGGAMPMYVSTDRTTCQPHQKAALSLPLPIQSDLLPVTLQTAITEYQLAFRNETAHLPEVALRYLICLVLGESDPDTIRAFVLQIRNELNDQRLAEFVRVHGGI